MKAPAHASSSRAAQRGGRHAGRFAHVLAACIHDPVSVMGILLVSAAIVCALIPGAVAHQDPNAQYLEATFLMPFAGVTHEHWLGTDWLGRDILSRIVYAARLSISVAAFTLCVRVTLGLTFGLLSGFYRGMMDGVLMQIVDLQLALPFILVALAVATLTHPSVLNVILILGVTGWMEYARLVRAEVIAMREREFVHAAEALGATSGRVIVRHVLPNTLGSVVALATIDVPGVILAESSLSFLGIGVPLSVPSWGGMVALGRDYLVTAWWVPILPGLAIALAVLGFSLLGDWVRDEIDPTLRRRA